MKKRQRRGAITGLRLAGWAWLTLRHDPERALDCFQRAADSSRLEDVEVVRAEIDYATAQLGEEPAV